MSVLTILELGRTRLAETDLARGAYARDKNGVSCGVNSEAVCYCTVGVLLYAGRAHVDAGAQMTTEFYDAQQLMRDLINSEYPVAGMTQTIPTWNDREGRTKEDVLALFDMAIEKAKQ